ncbi:hypothetical protein JI435_418340 [Parastagonospora nodorum SN15]|uniref:Uncharacterized protein n=1 Tax=Phaeosphaeria nodorum (strain SN15 / ATCC MYA-4574 / FGSC 10173) TaxID=321614 RepID=A0A7U2I441_PHANO|nr:hypothetical protein JI435_418340 [Parastagonospora nodorum SN15]
MTEVCGIFETVTCRLVQRLTFALAVGCARGLEFGFRFGFRGWSGGVLGGWAVRPWVSYCYDFSFIVRVKDWVVSGNRCDDTV